jgi:hypothetical protein
VADRHHRGIGRGRHQFRQLVEKARQRIWSEVETEGLDRDELVGLVVIRTKDRAQNAAANLMQDAELAKGGRRTGRIVKRQCDGSLRSGNPNTSVVD